ncbi:MAG TPA: hypothetical protein VGM26_04365 [Rhizomicrobium sp.]|jgi:hypothetical protein
MAALAALLGKRRKNELVPVTGNPSGVRKKKLGAPSAGWEDRRVAIF